jgi:hypothetical protein
METSRHRRYRWLPWYDEGDPRWEREANILYMFLVGCHLCGHFMQLAGTPSARATRNFGKIRACV